jgi:predicted nucleic acid-binding protein
MIVIADASCLITLDNLNETHLLPKLYEEICVTPEVAAEVGPSLPEWILLRSSANQILIDKLTEDLEIGEATSIALALEMPNCLLIIDEKKGRREAIRRGLEITGTFGVLMKGLEAGFIENPDTIVERVEQVGFRISKSLKDGMKDRIH